MKKIYFLIMTATKINILSMDDFTLSRDESRIHYQTHQGASHLFKDNDQTSAIIQCLKFASERTKEDRNQLPVFERLKIITELYHPTRAPQILAELNGNVAIAEMLSLLDKYHPKK